MERRDLHLRTPMGRELAQALQEWLSASRRAYDPQRDSRDLRAEELAWDKLRSALALDETLTAA